MSSKMLTELFRLPAAERADLAMALWESLDQREQTAELRLTQEDKLELDRRLAEHLEDPHTAIPWHPRRWRGRK